MEFKEAKRRKERGQTNEEFLKWVIAEAKDFEQISITVQFPSGLIETYFSQEGSLPLVGMLEVGKQQILNDMNN
ncbi:MULTISPECIES: hypothetical protein [Enterococcus]|uniref:hypothetical protein n=1 Tax=Enterococcus TaxID=1350 RepID=UPI00288EF5E6|nr:hypothetical protein [Enterococcus thailandicus]MDT2734080.1 hypothetical protein [Enterococcus thailandicus]MDT2753085.1 hypothetical protein [Enterococcus thailandicus]